MKRLTRVAILIGLALVAAGCGGPGNVETARLSISGLNIRFDYPAIYEMVPDGPGESSVNFVHFAGDVEDRKIDRRLYVGTVASTRTAFNQLQDDLLDSHAESRNVEYIVDGTMKIGGYQADIAAFDALLWNTGLNSSNITVWTAYFNRDNYIWELGVITITELEGAAEADFKVLAESFKFE